MGGSSRDSRRSPVQECVWKGISSGCSVHADQDGRRLDKYVSDMVHDLSRTYARQLIEDGHIRLNDRDARPRRAGPCRGCRLGEAPGGAADRSGGRGHPAHDHLRGRRCGGGRQAGWHGRPPSARPSQRHAGECVAGALPRYHRRAATCALGLSTGSIATPRACWSAPATILRSSRSRPNSKPAPCSKPILWSSRVASRSRRA